MIETLLQAPRQASPYLAEFERWERGGAGLDPAWLHLRRKAGLSRFTELGFPTPEHEDWRYTNVAPIARLPFKPFLEPSLMEPSRRSLDGLPFMSLPARRLVFVNGHYASGLSNPGAPQTGVTLTHLPAALSEEKGLAQAHLGHYVRGDENGFAALNLAFFTGGALIHLAENVRLDEPVHLVFVSSAAEPGETVHARNLIVAEKGSRMTVIESYYHLADAPYLTNTATELVAGEGAWIEHLKFQEESSEAFHLANFHARLDRAAQVFLHSFAQGAKLARNDIRTALAGEGIECILNGLYLPKAGQLADHHMVVEHAAPRCNSHEYFNGILEGTGRGVFHGRILVRPGAQKTDAKQTNKNLLLSDDATVNSKPQLEIYADDVKCTHGATIGQLSEASVFYLRARGIGLERARRMLIHAFAGEITGRVQCEALRDEVDRLVWQRLEENPGIAEAHIE